MPVGVKGFVKGQSGNPTGRPKEYQDIKKLAREHCADAIKKLAQWVAQDKDPGASVKAAQILLDRGYGKAEQHVEHSGEVIKYVIRTPNVAITTQEWQNQHAPQKTIQ